MKKNKALKIFSIGECMAEITIDSTLKSLIRFSGDAYNTLLYAKRWCSEIQASFLTGVGDDSLSQLMQKDAAFNQIDLSLTLTTQNHNLGIYTTKNDKNGECTFDYWRSTSAASQYFNLLKSENIKALENAFVPGAIIYFTGISMAILTASDKDKLLFTLQKLQKVGFTIAFDPNYRAKLWNNPSFAASYMTKCYELADLVFPGLEDHMHLFGHKNFEDMKQFFKQFSGKEIIFKVGEEGVFVIDKDNTQYHSPFIAAKHQIDATAAGDSFAGIYLAELATGSSIPQAIKAASSLSRLVVSHKGAVLPYDVFCEFKENYKQQRELT